MTSHYRVHHNFSIRGSIHIVNFNSKYVQAQVNSARRIKAREKSIERKIPTRTFNDETHLNASELLQVLKNKEVRWFKNGTSVPSEHRSYLSEPFNPHKAKKIYANREQKAAERYFVEIVKKKFRDLKISKAPDVLAIREKAIEKVFAKFRNHENVRPTMVYIKNLFVTIVAEFPAYGQQRAVNELRKRGIIISEGGVRSIWLRNDIKTFKKRLKALEAKVAQDGIVLTEEQLAALEKIKEQKEAHGEIETEHPGYLGSQDTYYVGNIKGIGPADFY